MAEEVSTAHVLGEEKLDRSNWDRMWEAADLPEGTCRQWQDVLGYRTQLPDDAVVLAHHGWTPEDVLRARANWIAAFPELGVGGSRWMVRTEEESAAWAVLANEVATYHENQRRLVLGERAQFISDLVERLPIERRWSQTKVAQLLGLTKQRVQEILKRTSLD